MKVKDAKPDTPVRKLNNATGVNKYGHITTKPYRRLGWTCVSVRWMGRTDEELQFVKDLEKDEQS